MAKSKKNDQYEQQSSRFIKTNRNVIQGGRIYEVVTEFKINRINYTMAVGSTFRQCYDMFYAAYDELGNKLFFRLGDEIIEDKNILQNLKIKTNE